MQPPSFRLSMHIEDNTRGDYEDIHKPAKTKEVKESTAAEVEQKINVIK